MSQRNVTATTALPQEGSSTQHSIHRHKPDVTPRRGLLFREGTRMPSGYHPSSHSPNSTFSVEALTTSTPTTPRQTTDNRYFQFTQTSYDNNSTPMYANVSNGTSNEPSKNGFLMLVDDFSDYFYNNFNTNLTFGENTTLSIRSDIFEYVNCSVNGTALNSSFCDNDAGSKGVVEYNYWSLILVLFPILTLFGNVLVILSVYRERTLQTVTNYFIVSLALADLLVAVVVMPFAVYVLVRCLECRQIFCCADCRRKHEEKVHSIAFECYICRYSSFILDPNIAHCGELIDHIESKHLPLHCSKCNKVFEKVQQLFENNICAKRKSVEDKSEEIESELKCVMSSIMPENGGILKKKCNHLRKDDKSAVMTSTPTHSNLPNWGLLQKSFTSTLSGINSPDSDVAQSPTENDKFNGTWGLPPFVCDFYIAMDVICSTSSIFNLVAISIDRYIAVTQPIKYAKHKNNRRVWLTIVLVWVISAAIGSPIVLGLNNTPDRLPDLCLFYNSDFIIYSSLSSFYIPCIIMVFLYYNIFKALRNRARKQRAARKQPLPGEIVGSVIENVAQTRRLAETALGPTKKPEEERPTNTASGSNEEDDDGGERSPDADVDDCHVISNDKSTEFILATVVEEAGNVMATLASPAVPHNDANGNNDSGYAPSNLEEPIKEQVSSGPNSPHVIVNKQQQQQLQQHLQQQQQQPKEQPQSQPPPQPQHVPQTAAVLQHKDGSVSFSKTALKTYKNGATSSPRDEKLPLKTASTMVRCAEELTRLGSGNSKKERKATAASRFTIYKVNKASKKKREKSSAKKERKATKTLAIVLGVFLICWVPFFTCNIMDAMCTKLGWDCQPGVTAFILTTWLGYMNSFVNPVIYTIFNPEFRKAFKKLMHMGT